MSAKTHLLSPDVFFKLKMHFRASLHPGPQGELTMLLPFPAQTMEKAFSDGNQLNAAA